MLFQGERIQIVNSTIKKKKKRGMNAGQMIVFSFLAMIFLGTGLLMLPVSLAEGAKPDFLTAVFTATSCTCVTGLVVVESGTHFSVFGQIVLLLLIQIGGLGFMTMAMLLFVTLGKKISLKERMIIKEAMNADSLQGMIPVLLMTCRLSFCIELIGAGLLATRFIPVFGWGKGIFYSVFHSVSAFCNAGFDIFGNGDSIAAFGSDPMVMSTLMGLILLGGLGFPVLADLLGKWRDQRRLTLHSKVVLFMTGILLSFGILLLLLLEAKSTQTLGRYSGFAKILNATFESVTLRTAGFASFNQNGLTTASKVICAIFMFIGASPASTGGGIKTTTMASVLLIVFSASRGNDSLRIFGRRLDRATVLRAVSIFVIALMVVVVLTLGLTYLEPAISFENLLFEASSALGTVGLTTGITPELRDASKGLLIIAMFIGRVGPLSLTLALAGRMNKNKVRIEYPEDRIIVG